MKDELNPEVMDLISKSKYGKEWNTLTPFFRMEIISKAEEILKAKKMPIGTVSNGRKKVAEGKWVPVGKKESQKKEDLKEEKLSKDHFKQGIEEIYKKHFPENEYDVKEKENFTNLGKQPSQEGEYHFRVHDPEHEKVGGFYTHGSAYNVPDEVLKDLKKKYKGTHNISRVGTKGGYYVRVKPKSKKN